MKIRVGRNDTISVGDYEFVKPLVEIEDDVQVSEESVAEAYIRVRQLVNDIWTKELQLQVDEVLKAKS